VDKISERPHAMTNYQLQGMKVCYDSARVAAKVTVSGLPLSNVEKGNGMISRNGRRNSCLRTGANPREATPSPGHRGGDYFVIQDFLAGVFGEMLLPIGIHEAMDMTLPGLISQVTGATPG